MARSQSQKLSSSARSEVGAGSQSESGSIQLKGDEVYEINDIKDEKLNAVLNDAQFQKDIVEYYDADGKAEEAVYENQDGDNVKFDWFTDSSVPNIKIGDRFISFYPPELEAEVEQDGYDEYITPSADGYGKSNRGDPIYKSVSRYDEGDLFNDEATVYVWDNDDKRIKDFVRKTDRDGKGETIGGYEVWREKTKREKEMENKA